MAERSKGFGKPVYTKKAKARGQKDLQKFANQFSQSPVSDRFTKLVTNPKGVGKMSDILQEFAEPYCEMAETYDQRKKMFETAMLAWNLCLIPEDDRAVFLVELLEKEFSNDRERQDFKYVVGEMMTRKLTYFADVRRTIVEFQLVDHGHAFHLSVASTMPGNS